ncbi:MAG: glycine--tRNA ligase subunit alpha [Alphaproteobacteria bacterium]|nr:MAG: glycine--tRNA ligase subunit alpha [Alphaproteobacteria bacterium]
MITFIDIINRLTSYWGKLGCKIILPTDIPVGAATMHPYFILNARQKHKLAYIQGCRRPQDSRTNSKNRLYKHHQFQVTINPIPQNIQDLYLDSLKDLGFAFDNHEIKFIAGNWQSPNLGAFGVGSEVWVDNSEISQFTYFQQIGGKAMKSPVVELTYGLERIAMHLQQVDDWRKIYWQKNLQYEDLDDKEFSLASNDAYDIEILLSLFDISLKNATELLKNQLQYPAYESFLYASHYFNTLEARQAFSSTERVNFMEKLRHVGEKCVNFGDHDE